jgi:hypothetical protein
MEPGMKRLILLIGLGIGYVLGSKAGREQYRKIKDTASKTWQSPTVRNAAEKVEAFVDEKVPALGGVAHSVLGGSESTGSSSGGGSSTGSGSGGGSSTGSGSGSGSASGSGADSGSNGGAASGTPDASTAEPSTGVDLGDDLRLDTDLGTEGERPA